MKNNKRWTLGLFLLLVLSVVLAACSSDSEEDEGTTSDTSTDTETTTEEKPEVAQVLVFGRAHKQGLELAPPTITPVYTDATVRHKDFH